MKKVLLAGCQGHTNEKHTEVPNNITKISLHSELYQQHLLAWTLGERHPLSLLVTEWANMITMEVRMDIAKKTENGPAI